MFRYQAKKSARSVELNYVPPFLQQVIESSGFGADKFTMVRNNDGTGSLKVVQPLDYEDQLQRQGFRFRIQVCLHS